MSPGSPVNAAMAAPAVTDDFAELSRAVRSAGLLSRRRWYYGLKIGATLGALGVLGAGVVVVGDSWWSISLAVGLAFLLTQIGFIGHDAGHRQICASRRGNDLIGLACADLFTGFSFGWWVNKHNRHHAHTNREGKDPDIAANALIYLPEQLDRRGRFGRGFARVQGGLLLPLLLLEALNLHYSSIRALLVRRDRGAVLEATLLGAHAAIFFVAPFLILSPARAVVFVVVAQALFGFYLGISFVTNHIGLPVLGGTDRLGFLRRQVLTSRNLSGRGFTSFIFGGLDSQIEHHLFPTMPRANLRRARRLVRSACDQHRIAYLEQSPLRAYAAVIRHLSIAGAGSAVPVIG